MTADDLRTLIGANRQACVAQKTSAEQVALMNQGALNILDQLAAQMEAMEKTQAEAEAKFIAEAEAADRDE